MAPVRRHTVHLPGGLQLTILRLHASMVSVAALRSMLTADWYVLAGQTYQVSTDGAPDHPTGYGCYIGTTERLQAQVQRAGVSLRTWSTSGPWRLQPQTLVLVTKTGQPVNQHARLIVEARLARSVSAAGFTLLNSTSGAPLAHRRASRYHRKWAMHTADRLASVILRQVFHGHQPRYLGGSTHEQLTRLVLQQRPPRAMDIDDVLQTARDAGIAITAAEPRQRTRRDLTTRERDTGAPRVYRMHIAGRTVVYPAGMSLTEARRNYLTQHPGAQARLARSQARRRKRRNDQR
jgi:hypothetical protein